MTTDSDRQRLRDTFNLAAGVYQQVRPDYPDDLFDDLVAVIGLAPGDRVLKIGCATGKATLPLARRGFWLTCLEPGPQLAAAARTNVMGLPVEITEERFERDRLYAEIRRRLDRCPHSAVRRHWGAVLHIARRCAASAC